jgi:glycolate dehydrogenase iron-sulfur subunit
MSASPSSGIRGTPIDDALLAACIHCGLCLETCPTFVLTGREEESPRGRLLLSRGLADGRWPARPDVLEPIDHCLGCRACETACPSGVRYGRILEETRAGVAGERSPRSALESFLVRHVLWRVGLLEVTAWVYRGLRLRGGARGLARVPGIPESWRERLRIAPRLEPRPAGGASPPAAAGSPAATLVRGCVARAFFPAAEDAMRRLLEKAGYAVVLADRPGCCGALAAHAGEPEVAHRCDAETLKNLAGAPGIIVLSAAGCGAHVKGLGDRRTGADAATAAAIAARVRDLTEALLQAPVPLRWRKAGETIAVYQDACHLRHGQGIVEEPRALLAAAGYTLREAEESDLCCGSAGTYNLAHPTMAAALGRRKADRLRATGAGLVVTANPGCAVQLEAHLGRPGDPPVITLAAALAAGLAP